MNIGKSAGQHCEVNFLETELWICAEIIQNLREEDNRIILVERHACFVLEFEKRCRIECPNNDVYFVRYARCRCKT